MKTPPENLIKTPSTRYGVESVRAAWEDWVLKSWEERYAFPTQDAEWTQLVLEQYRGKILNHWKSAEDEPVSPSQILLKLQEQADTVLPWVFFVPEAVNYLYSQSENSANWFVNEGLRHHNRFVRRAVKSVIGRFIPKSDFLSMGKNELEEELWSCTLEEIIRSLTDYLTRFWSKAELLKTFPPEKSHSKKSGIIVRVALSEAGNRLLTVHSEPILTLWDTQSGELIRTWDLHLLPSYGTAARKDWSPPSVFFSPSGDRIAIDLPAGEVLTVSVSESDPVIRTYTEKSKKQFLEQFGLPFIPDHPPADLEKLRIHSRAGREYTLKQYLEKIYDWTCDRDGRWIVTAGEKDRCMPKWMSDIGFEKAVYLIAKRRLIDLIRRQTQTGYRCWYCGAMGANAEETICSNCGGDFTVCPLGCPIPPSERLDRGNHWTCPHCRCRSRIPEMQEIIHEDVEGMSDDTATESWKDRHDLQRIFSRLQRIFVTYKDRQIACDLLTRLKMEGKTNEEIGKIIGIPRGSVDYIWNQCREQAAQIWGTM